MRMPSVPIRVTQWEPRDDIVVFQVASDSWQRELMVSWTEVLATALRPSPLERQLSRLMVEVEAFERLVREDRDW
jgi:hypothetical protein